MALADRLACIGKSKNTTLAVLALVWLLHHPAGIVPITGSGTPEHITQNGTADRIRLTDAEWYALLAAAVELKTVTGGRS